MSIQDQTSQAPDFTLVDTHDQAVELSDFRDHNHVILVFNRGFF